MRWWRTARRALSLAGIFDVLEANQKKAGQSRKKPLEQMYETKVAEIEKNAAAADGRDEKETTTKMYRFRHARTYARLGRFLADHPDLINQTLLVTLSDWTKGVIVEEDDDNDNDAGEEEEIATGNVSDEEEGRDAVNGKGKEEDDDDDENDGNASEKSAVKKGKANGGKAKQQQPKGKPRKKYLMDFVDKLMLDKDDE
jgi:hypothetical protein